MNRPNENLDRRILLSSSSPCFLFLAPRRLRSLPSRRKKGGQKRNSKNLEEGQGTELVAAVLPAIQEPFGVRVLSPKHPRASVSPNSGRGEIMAITNVLFNPEYDGRFTSSSPHMHPWNTDPGPSFPSTSDDKIAAHRPRPIDVIPKELPGSFRSVYSPDKVQSPSQVPSEARPPSPPDQERTPTHLKTDNGNMVCSRSGFNASADQRKGLEERRSSSDLSFEGSRPKSGLLAVPPLSRNTLMRFKDGHVVTVVPGLEPLSLLDPEPLPTTPQRDSHGSADTPGRIRCRSASCPRNISHPWHSSWDGMQNSNIAVPARGSTFPLAGSEVHPFRRSLPVLPPRKLQFPADPGSSPRGSMLPNPDLFYTSCSQPECISHQVGGTHGLLQKSLVNGSSNGSSKSLGGSLFLGRLGSKSLGKGPPVETPTRRVPSLKGNTWDSKTAETERVESDVPLIKQKDIPVYRLDGAKLHASPHGSITPPEPEEAVAVPAVVRPWGPPPVRTPFQRRSWNGLESLHAQCVFLSMDWTYCSRKAVSTA